MVVQSVTARGAGARPGEGGADPGVGDRRQGEGEDPPPRQHREIQPLARHLNPGPDPRTGTFLELPQNRDTHRHHIFHPSTSYISSHRYFIVPDHRKTDISVPLLGKFQEGPGSGAVLGFLTRGPCGRTSGRKTTGTRPTGPPATTARCRGTSAPWRAAPPPRDPAGRPPAPPAP